VRNEGLVEENVMGKKVVIIGAGIGGLSAGFYARMNGYETEILEAHSQPGGLCTSWKRKGYVIDGSCHWLMGSGPGHPLFSVWEELGAVQERRIVDYEYFVRFTGPDGRVFFMYTDVDRLERHMKELSPADAGQTEKLCGLVRKLAGFSMPVGKTPELMGALDGIRMMRRFRPFMKIFQELGAITLAQFAAGFNDQLLRDGIAQSLFGAPGSLFPLVMTLGAMSRKAAGYPVGGSLEFARSIERRFTRLGGKVTYGAPVEKVLERDGKARGVRLVNGREIDADYVISACDLKNTLQSLLDGTRMDPVHGELLANGTLTDPCVQVTFGIDMKTSGEPAGMSDSLRLPSPLCIGGRQVEWINVKNYSYDPSMAPSGKSVFTSILLTDWSHWEKLKEDPRAYEGEKERIAAACAEALECHYPGCRQKIEMTDVATPLTYARYTGNWKGTYMTWNLTGEFRRKHRFIPKTVPGLDGFYMASMWTNAPGGVPGAALAGRGVVQLLCARDRKRFLTTRY
jgi:phytoene dehydrogenase-like protein